MSVSSEDKIHDPVRQRVRGSNAKYQAIEYRFKPWWEDESGESEDESQGPIRHKVRA